MEGLLGRVLGRLRQVRNAAVWLRRGKDDLWTELLGSTLLTLPLALVLLWVWLAHR